VSVSVPEVAVRIGLIAPPWIPVPPPAYGGTEAVLDNLARGLAELGHDVRLFTVGESTCPVTRMHLYPRAVEPIGELVHEAAHTLAAYEALTDVDVIHDHTTIGPLLADIHRGPAPVVVTNHGPFSTQTRRILAAAARTAAAVAISHAHARSAGQIPIAAVIHHGIDTTVYRPGPGGGGYLLFIGRMCPDKGVHRAGRRLVIVAKMREPAEHAYFQREVRPLLRDTDQLLIESSLAERVHLLRHADALINPIGWPEPFGLVMAEALACGTPVLAFPHGAAPEIVDHDRIGYLCTDETDMAAAVQRLPAIDRRTCRTVAEQRFSLRRMALDHQRLYQDILTTRQPVLAGAASRGRP
jgi:glycosyltransferase involved in cell wall biosynthesis